MAKKTKDTQEIDEKALGNIAGGGPGEVTMERPMTPIERPPSVPVRPPVEVPRAPVDASPSHFESSRPPQLEMPKQARPEAMPGATRTVLPEARPMLPGVEANPEAQRRVKEAFSEVVPRPDLFSASPSAKDSWRAPAHDISGMSRQIVQQRIEAEPGKVAADVAKRATAFLADSKSWWTGQGVAKEVLSSIQKKADELTHKQNFTDSDKKELFNQLDRLQAFEQYHGKVSLGDAYVADFVQKRAGSLGLRGEALDQLSKQAATKAFEPEQVSKNADAAQAARDALKQYTEQLADRRFGSEALMSGDAFNRLVESEPYAAHLYLQREAQRTLQTLESRREYDFYGNLFEDPELESQIENLQKILEKPYSDNSIDIRNTRGQLALIQNAAGLSMFKEGVADKQENAQIVDQLKQAAAQQRARPVEETGQTTQPRASDPLRQLAQQNPVAAFEILQKRAGALKEELGSGLGSYLRGDALAQLDQIANMSQTSFEGDGQRLPEKFEGILNQLETLESAFGRAKTSEVASSVVAGAGDLNDVSLRAPLADKVKASPAPINVLPDLLSVIDRLPSYGARAQVDALNQRVQGQLGAKSLDSMAADYKSGMPWYKRMLVGPSVDALVGAAKGGQFDAALSPQGINNVLSAVNRGISELKEPRATPADMGRMQAEHKQNIADAAQRITDLALPSSWWNPIQGIKRLIVNYYAKQALEGYNNHALATDSPLQRQLSTITGADISSGTTEQQMARKLAVSRLMAAATAELARPKPQEVEGVNAGVEGQRQIQQLLTQLNLPGAVGLAGLDPNTWKGWAAGKASAFTQENVRARSEESARARDAGQQTLLNFWRDFRTQNPKEANLPQLQGAIQNHDYKTASDLIRMQMSQLESSGQLSHLAEWTNMLRFTEQMQHLAPMSETISKAYDGLVTNGIAPWLRGQPVAPTKS